jgi:Fasciclin domain
VKSHNSTRTKLLLFLDDGRTFSFFAPTDEALAGASPEITQLLEANNTPERKAALKVLLERHIAPGTLFSEGVTYYQAASTLAADQPLRLFNDHGKNTKLYRPSLNYLA